MNFKLYFGLSAILLTIAVNLPAQNAPTVSMTTEKAIGSSISFVVNHGLNLSIDWGDGTIHPLTTSNDPIQGTVKGPNIKLSADGITHLDCSESGLTQLDVSQISTLMTLDCSNNKLCELDILNNLNIRKVNASFNQLTAFQLKNEFKGLTDLIVNNNQLTTLSVTGIPSLETIICNDNQIVSLFFSELVNLRTLWCHNNKIKSLNAANKKQLQTLICYNNLLTSAIVSGCNSLTEFWCDQNMIASLNLSASKNLQFVSADQNAIKTLLLDKAIQNLYINNNKLGLNKLPINGGTNDYVFSPQEIELPKTHTQTTPIDLSAQLTLSDNTPSEAQFSWSYFEGTLQPNTDYTETNGVFTFNRPAGIAVCTITSSKFPNLTLKTSPTDIGAVSSIESNQAASLKLFTRKGQLIIDSKEPQSVRINHISGQTIQNLAPFTGEITVNLPKGVYLVNHSKVVIY